MTAEQEARQVAALERIADALAGKAGISADQAAQLSLVPRLADERDRALVRATKAEAELAALAPKVAKTEPSSAEEPAEVP